MSRTSDKFTRRERLTLGDVGIILLFGPFLLALLIARVLWAPLVTLLLLWALWNCAGCAETTQQREDRAGRDLQKRFNGL